MNKANLNKTLVALMLVAAGTTAFAGDGVNGLSTNGASNGRNALDSLLLHFAQSVMKRTAAPMEPVATVRVKTKSAPLALAKAVPASMARTNMVAGND